MRIVFIADYFADEMIGGAELSLQARIDTCPYPFITVRSRELDLTKLDKATDFLIIGNFAEFNLKQFLEIQGGVFTKPWNYVVEECDYKYCVVRSSHKHLAVFGQPCDCHKRQQGRRVADFFRRAKLVFWKAERQRQEYGRLFPGLQDLPGAIMGGVFTDEWLGYIMDLKSRAKDKMYFILKTDSWIKGYEEALKYSEQNNLPRRIDGGLQYKDMLKTMARCKGLIYMPRGFDPSCRMITEAKLMGLDIRTNDLVQHMTEPWFNSGEAGMLSFLRSRTKVFWDKVNEAIIKSA